METLLKKIDQLILLLQKYLEVTMDPPALSPVRLADEWMSPNEVMKVLKISPKTLYNYSRRGFFEYKEIGRTKYYSKASVMAITNV